MIEALDESTSADLVARLRLDGWRPIPPFTGERLTALKDGPVTLVPPREGYTIEVARGWYRYIKVEKS